MKSLFDRNRRGRRIALCANFTVKYMILCSTFTLVPCSSYTKSLAKVSYPLLCEKRHFHQKYQLRLTAYIAWCNYARTELGTNEFFNYVCFHAFYNKTVLGKILTYYSIYGCNHEWQLLLHLPSTSISGEIIFWNRSAACHWLETI